MNSYKAPKELEKTNEKRSEKSVELKTRKNELDQFQTTANDMSVKLETTDIESQFPNRIRQVQQAVIDN